MIYVKKWCRRSIQPESNNEINNEIPVAHNGINAQGLNDRSLSVMEGGADPTRVKSNVNESGASMSNNEIPVAHNGIIKRNGISRD